ncbi:hypothetical protein SAMN06295974_3729 [Plantibacter flavus]|uniref:Uncharacterized protein n=1 Tax=Plantibacter flavus TaxID=150123 RepID=A0A3N2BLH2_9MICO|nr:hypothetical protein [Plantibacter flavus]ROR76123.1 hypothetical protein EDD42_4076 [Plantibacter flavus]SMG48415.1 hypothetical protein SAMN06295974_3729 [Plantibacter flavus]
MTESNSPAAVPDRTLPQELLDLAVLAIKRGAWKVSLIHEGLGADFRAPIGWLLYINEPSPDPFSPGAFTAISHQVGCDFNDFVLPESLAGEDLADQAVVDVLLELFQESVRNGWESSYERKVLDHAIWLESTQRLGLEAPPMRHSLQATAHNWAWNPEAGARGESISTDTTLSTDLTDSDRWLAFVGGTQVARADIERMLRSAAPNRVPVAYFDEAADGWIK